MIEGTLIAESLRIGTNLENLKLTVRKISRYRAQGSTPDQPDIWTTLDFEADEAVAQELAEAFADALDQPGWYVRRTFARPACHHSRAKTMIWTAASTRNSDGVPLVPDPMKAWSQPPK